MPANHPSTLYRTLLVALTFAAMTLCLSLVARPAGAAPTVCGFPAVVANETELNDAITCFNAETMPGTYQITLTAAIDLNASTTTISNATAGVELVIEGGGGGVNAWGQIDVRPFTVDNATVTLRNMFVLGGAVNGSGGGIYSSLADLTIVNSIVHFGTPSGDGGGIYAYQSTVKIINSTVSNNEVPGDGGGIYGENSDLSIINSTFNDNVASSGGGLYLSSGTATIDNSIIANSTGGDCVRAGGAIDARNNIIEDGLGCIDGTNSNNQVGDPGLGSLGFYGGQTSIYPLLPGSIAINAGSNALAVDQNNNPLTTDQRGPGFERIAGVDVDAGAFEAQTCPAFPITVADDNELNVAIVCYNELVAAGAYTIALGADISLSNSTVQINNPTAGISLVIEGKNATVDGNDIPSLRPFYIDVDTDVTMNDITITGGNHGGGAIYNTGNLWINDSLITGNQGGPGGGIYSDFGSYLEINRSIISHNTAPFYGGGIHISGQSNSRATANIYDSTINDNLAGDSAGGLWIANADVILANSTVSANTATAFYGGGISVNAGGKLQLINSTITGNSSGQFGAGLHSQVPTGDVTYVNTIIADQLSGPDCGFRNTTGPGTSLGNNLDSDNTCDLTAGGDIAGGTPDLGPLQLNGGPTETHALLSASQAIDAGDNTTCANAPIGNLDQRGVLRPIGTNCDIGAFEYGATGFTIIKDAIPPDGTNFHYTAAGQIDVDIVDAARGAALSQLDLAPGSAAASVTGPDAVQNDNFCLIEAPVSRSALTFEISCDFTLDDAVPDDLDSYADQADVYLIGFEYSPDQTQAIQQEILPIVSLEIKVTEDVVPDWELIDITCHGTNGSSAVPDVDNLAVALGVRGTDWVTCTFTNEQDGVLEVTKVVDWGAMLPDENQTFELCIQGPTYPSGDCALVDYDGETISWTGLEPGEYIVSETDPGEPWTVSIEGSPAPVGAGQTAQVTVTNSQATAIKLVESYAVSSVEEGILTGPGSKACYWVTSTVELDGEVVIDIAPQNGEVTVNKSQVTLDSSNWDNLGQNGRSNFVCIRAIDDQVDDGGAQQCKNGTADLYGTGVPGPAYQECGDHVDEIQHTIVSSTDSTITPATPFMSNNSDPAQDLDSDPSTVDALVRNNDEAAVIITESYAVSDLDEAGSPVGKACYWITLASQPTADVTVGAAPDNSQVTTDKTQVLLTNGNWNLLNPAGNTFNRVCITPVPDNIVDGSDPACFTGSADKLGAAGDGAEVCGTHQGLVKHSVVSVDPNYDPSVPFDGNGFNPDGERSTINVLIRDDDAAGLVFKPATVNLLEGQQTSYQITLASQPKSDVTVQANGQTLTFKPNTWNAPQQITVSAPQNDIAGDSKTELLAHTVSSADADYNGLASEALEATIVDDDRAGVYLSTTKVEVSEDGNTAVYEAILTSQPTSNVTVSLATTSQLTIQPRSLTFTPSNWNTPQKVTVGGYNDKIAEDDHKATITHQVTSSDGGYDALKVAKIKAAIGDNDQAGVIFSKQGVTVSEDGTQKESYSVVLASEPKRTVEVAVNGGEQLKVLTTLTFTAANWNVPQVVTVTAVDDQIDEGTAQQTGVDHVVSSKDGFYDHIEVPDLSATINDNDTAGVILSKTAVPGGSGSYTVVLTSQPEGPVVVDLAAKGKVILDVSGCTDGEGSASCLLFEPNKWNVPQTVHYTSSGPGTVQHSVASADRIYAGLKVHEVGIDAVYSIFMPVTQK